MQACSFCQFYYSLLSLAVGNKEIKFYTLTQDVFIRDMVKFIFPATYAQNQPRIARSLQKSEYSPFSIQMVLVGFKYLGFGLSQFWKDSLWGISHSPSY